MRKITVRNKFHHLELTLNFQKGQKCLSRAQTQKIRRELCGISDCKCLGSAIYFYEGVYSLFTQRTLLKDSKGEFETIQLFW